MEFTSNPPRMPAATYRVQLHKGFTFRDAAAIVPYLARLGITDLYTSPFFKANPGSMHGYDVVDYGELNPEIGTRADYDALAAVLREHEMGLLVDFVPNHMGIASGRNVWWQDVLENGKSSPYAPYFDIDWQPIKPELQDQVLLPVLGEHYGEVLERGELRVAFRDGTLAIDYYELPLPLAPETYPAVLRQALPDIQAVMGAEELPLLELQSIATAFERLPAVADRDAEALTVRSREILVARNRLRQLIESSPVIARAIEAAVTRLNGSPDDPRSFDALDELIGRQNYRLAFWKVAAEEINYRRFFAINELAAIRQEVPAVFNATHGLLLELIADGSITGVRIDHPDGLWDPAGYFRDLQRAAYLARAGGDVELGPRWDERWAADPRDPGLRSIFLLIEKIVEPGEVIPREWMVDGTVGYELIRQIGGLQIDGQNRKAFDELYQRFTGDTERFADLVYEQKKLMMRVALASEVNVLARILDRLSELHRRTRDFPFNTLRLAMREIIACFPVYRTYVDCERATIAPRDRAFVERAFRDAVRRNPGSDRGAFEFVRDVLLLTRADELTSEHLDEHCRFIMKFQQLTGPVMAKGLEDTTFYVDNRLVSLNEVGGDPGTFGIAVTEFHKQVAARAADWPHAMLASSTHDTKRGEDVRARISPLSELPREWRAALNRWARMNRSYKTSVDGSSAPDRNDEYQLYQVLLGAWPVGASAPTEAFIDRIDAYLAKAIHEAQVHTSWINPHEAYDEATQRFIRGVLSAENRRFLDDFAAFQTRIAAAGAWNGLAQQLIKLTGPGVADVYQGTEIWDDSLVDPDNRRPVDYRARRRLLDKVIAQAEAPKRRRALMADPTDPRAKLWLTHAALQARRADPDLFLNGAYVPLTVSGPHADHAVAFARRFEARTAITVAPRFLTALTKPGAPPPIGELWEGTTLDLSALGDQQFCELLSGQSVQADRPGGLPLAELFAIAPIALLVPEVRS